MKITRHGAEAETNGQPPMIGKVVPEFELLGQEGAVTDSTLKGKFTLISVVPDINTRVCSLSTKKFNEDADKFDNINFLTVSTNTLEQQAEWCAAQNVKRMQLVSDADASFGQALGIYLSDAKVDARSVWILDGEGTIRYRELVIEQSDEPDYASALAYLETHQG